MATVEYIDNIEDIKKYYADLLILQYRSKKKARQTVQLGVDIYLADGLVMQLQDILDIDKAEGAQLDLIGKILDCPRNIQGLASDVDYFEFNTNNDTDSLGFSTVDKLSGGLFKNKFLNKYSIYSLLDRDYRVLLKFKAIANRAVGSWQQLDDLYYQIFGNYVTIENNKDLTITYNVDQTLGKAVYAAEMLGYFEPPCGIGYQIHHIPLSKFGFQNKTYAANPKGFSTKNGTSDGVFLTKAVWS